MVMNMKKSFLIVSLGLAASLQAQEAPAATEAQPATAADQAVTTVETPAEPAAVTENAAPAETPAVAAPVADQPSENATTAEAPATDSPAVEATPAETTPVNVEAAPANSAVVQNAEAPTTPAESPIQETAAVEAAPVATADSSASEVSSASEESKNSPVSSEQKTVAGPLDVLHGSAYNTVGNEAAGSTITGNMATPRKMFGTKSVYFEPISERAVVSFGDTRTYFIGFDNSKDLGIVTAGMSFGKFGFSVDGSLGKKWLDVEAPDGSEQNAVNTYGGSMVGATASLLAGSVDVVVSGHFIKPDSETYIKSPTNEIDPKSWSATGTAAASHCGNVVCWAASVDFLRHDFKTKAKNSYYQVIDGENKLVTVKASVSDTSSRTEFTPNFNIGSAILSAEDAKVYIGVNASIPVAFYDEIDQVVDKRTRLDVNLAPNILGEVALSKYFMAFGGASFDWNAFAYEKTELNGASTVSRETVSGKTTVNMGARFQYNRLAVEAAFTKQILQNPFAGFAKADGIVLDLGAFINF